MGNFCKETCKHETRSQQEAAMKTDDGKKTIALLSRKKEKLLSFIFRGIVKKTGKQ